MAAILSGIKQVSIQGQSYDIKPDVKFELSTVKREEVISQNGRVMYNENPSAGSVEFDVYITSDVNPQIFQSLTNAIVTVSLGNKMSLVVVNGFNTAPVDFDAKEGTCKVKFVSNIVIITTAPSAS
jgi:hypothetical protein